MTDHRLLTFINLVKLGNYTKTAKVLHMTQPAVTQHIKHLEAHYNTKLFYKKGKLITLTEEGKILLEYAQKMSSLSDKVERLMNGKEGISKKYNLGATLTVGGYLVPELLVRYKNNNPLIDISVAVKNTENILKALENESIDLALIEGFFPKDKFNFKLLKEDELILVASPKNPLTSKKNISIKSLCDEKLILREKGSGTRECFVRELEDKGWTLDRFDIHMEIENLHAIKTLVQSNIGVTIISKEVVKQDLIEGTLIHIPVKELNLKREFNFIYLENEYNKEFIEHFIESCNSYFYENKN